MTTRSRSDDLTQQAPWRQVLGMGEKLIRLTRQAFANEGAVSSTAVADGQAAPSTEAVPSTAQALTSLVSQHEVIRSTTGRLLNGTARLWIPEAVVREFVGQAAQATALGPEPSGLMRCAMENCQVCGGQDAEKGLGINLLGSGSGDGYQMLVLAVPLMASANLPTEGECQVLGVLQVERLEEPSFNQTDAELLEGIAAQAALALQTGLQTAKERQRLKQLTLLSEVSNAITSILDTENLLNEVINLIEKRFGYPYVHLFSVHPGRRKIFYEAGSGPISEILREQGFAYDLDDSQGLIPWVARSGEPLMVNDVTQEPRYRPSALPPDNTRSELTIPLVFGSQVLGILDIQSEQLHAFNEEDSFLFKALADNIAIAMRNATLYRSEVWRRQAADSLREVAGLLSADVELEQVLEAILTELERNLPLEVAAIWLREDEEAENGRPELHLAAVRGESVGELDIELGLSPEDILEFNPPAEAGITPQQASDWIIQALETDQPVTRTQNSLYDPLGAALGFPLDYSAIAAPLRVGQQSMGVLTLAHHTPGRYGGEAQTMTAAFASYAAVAIENTRLYEDAHEQAWVSTVLLQVAEATQSQTNLNELLDTVIRITPTLAGVKACLLYMLEEGEIFVPAAASGLNDEQKAEFERWRFGLGDSQALDQLLANRQPVILRADADQELSSIFFRDEKSRAFMHTELLVLVPLLAHTEIFGAFLVNYSPGAHGVSRVSLEDFFDEQLAIIQGIAHQTAIAVENIRLIKSQREEAYISVALLQVAQAVVGSKDLDDALGSIVRITPILVGVKRVAVFLWDAAQSVFHLSQTYGISRVVKCCDYSRSEFPLLDAVCERDSLVAYPLINGEDTFGDVPDDWSFLIPPDPEEVEIHLEGRDGLLMAFPLSVKGEVLGVMVVEEPDAISVAAGMGSNGGHRARGKRLEIITGISQQAAMAIQNDVLQSEIVERERLEREMQLAREIQRTFLPQKAPDFPGWDLKVRWRTAREVGGDFYDFFELPGKRLGLVIADVADKGMPAALYMTLVRTLMRATVQQVDAPWEVLERVNDIMVPDAPRGMFVTLAYAVVHMDTGEVEFANAGHNPPLWVQHKDCKLERLTRGNMALGVMEGMYMEGRRFNLEVGDYLVMYTDGVTEAFSPEEELFGEERLQQVIEQTVTCSISDSATGGDPDSGNSQVVLDAIDQAVTGFTGATMLSDDLTLLVIRRE